MRFYDSTLRRREALVTLLTDPCEEVRIAASEAIERLEGVGSLAEVLETLKKGNMGAKVKALYALGRIGGEEVLPPLVYCASRPEDDIRSVAVEMLGVLALPGAIPTIRERLADPVPAIRAKAIAALGSFNDPSLAPLLIPFLDAGDGFLDAEAALSLSRIGGGKLEAKFIELLRSPHPRTREAAATALGRLKVS